MVKFSYSLPGPRAIIAPTAFFLALLTIAPAFGQMKYPENVWVSYSNFRQVTDVAVSPTYVYIATTGGVLRYDLYKKTWDTPWVIVRGLEASVDLRGAVNVDFLPDNNNVAVLTSQGAYLYDPTAGYWVTTQRSFTPPAQVMLNQAIFFDLPGTTVTNRNYFLQGNNAIMDKELHSHQLGPYAADSWGFWWIGVQGVGVLQLDSRMMRGIMWEMGLYGTSIQAMTRGDGWIIMGGNNPDGGISIWKPEATLWDHLEPRYNASLQSGMVSDLAAAGHLALAATNFGVTQFDLRNAVGRTWRVAEGLWSNTVNGVTAEGDTAWAAMDNGVSYIALPKGPTKRLMIGGLKNIPCYRIKADQHGLWIGNDAGLFYVDRSSGEGQYVEPTGGLSGTVTALFIDPKEIWAGRITGLEVINRETLGQTGFPEETYFAGAHIRDILPVDSLVYLATDQGLWKLDRSRNSWHQYKKADGLISENVYALLRDGDYLLIGTDEGVTRFFWNDRSRID